MTRIASLLPSATEIVCALGARDDLVAVSHECDHPIRLGELPTVTRTRLSLDPQSGAIDANLRLLVASALALYEVDVPALEAAAPDVIVTQDLCDVCAVSFADVERAVAQLTSADVQIVNLRPTELGHIFDDVRTVGAAVGRREAGEAVAAKLEARVAAIAARASELPERPNVLTIEWLDPVMIGGTWMPELAQAAGGNALVTQRGEHAPTLSLEELRALDPAPDVVLVKPCGFSLERSERELDAIQELFATLDWPAKRSGRVYLADGNAFFNRPGPRIVESLEILAACVAPEAFADFAQQHANDYRSVSV